MNPDGLTKKNNIMRTIKNRNENGRPKKEAIDRWQYRASIKLGLIEYKALLRRYAKCECSRTYHSEYIQRLFAKFHCQKKRLKLLPTPK